MTSGNEASELNTNKMLKAFEREAKAAPVLHVVVCLLASVLTIFALGMDISIVLDTESWIEGMGFACEPIVLPVVAALFGAGLLTLIPQRLRFLSANLLFASLFLGVLVNYVAVEALANEGVHTKWAVVVSVLAPLGGLYQLAMWFRFNEWLFVWIVGFDGLFLATAYFTGLYAQRIAHDEVKEFRAHMKSEADKEADRRLDEQVRYDTDDEYETDY